MKTLQHAVQTPINPERVVILGAKGVIGKALQKVLEHNAIPLLALGREEIDLTSEGAEKKLTAYLNLTDTVVFLSTITPDKGRGNAAFMKNARMAEVACAAFEKVSPAHVVYLSSDTVYPLSEGVIDETTPAEPENLYGLMHLAREYMFRENLSSPLACLRSTLVYSEEDTHNSYGPNRFRRMAKQDGVIRLFGNGEEKRDHIFVQDLAQLILHVIRYRSSGVLNLVTGRSISYADLANTVASFFDAPIEIQTSKRQNPITHRHYDPALIHKAFPFFSFTPLQEGLATTHKKELELISTQ